MKNNKKINEIKNNIEKMKKDLAEQEKLVAKLEKGTYEIGDEVKWCGIDWYVIKIINDCNLVETEESRYLNTKQNAVLVSKEVFESMTYSDRNSNDYKESNIKEYLEECFINKLDKSKLIEMTTNYDEDKYYVGKVRIPTLREIEALPMSIRNCGNYYWTMTTSYGVSEDSPCAYVFRVGNDGQLWDNNVNITTRGVRPVITLSTNELE